MSREVLAWPVALEQEHGIAIATAAGENERIESAVGFDHLGDFEALVDLKPAGNRVDHVQFSDDGETASDRFADRAKTFA